MWRLFPATLLLVLVSVQGEGIVDPHPRDCSDPDTQPWVYNHIRFECGPGNSVVPIGCNSYANGSGVDMPFGVYEDGNFVYDCQETPDYHGVYEIIACKRPGGDIVIGSNDSPGTWEDPANGDLYRCWRMWNGTIKLVVDEFKGCWFDGEGYSRGSDFISQDGKIQYRCSANATGLFVVPKACVFEDPGGPDIHVPLGDLFIKDGLMFTCNNVSDPQIYNPNVCVYVDSLTGNEEEIRVGDSYRDLGTGTMYGCDLLQNETVVPEVLGCYAGDGVPMIPLYLKRRAEAVCPLEKPIGWCGMNDTSQVFQLRCLGENVGDCIDNDGAIVEANEYFVSEGIRFRCNMIVQRNGDISSKLVSTHCAYPLGLDSQNETEYKLVRRTVSKTFFDDALNKTVEVRCEGPRDNITMVVVDANNPDVIIEPRYPDRVIVSGGGGSAEGQAPDNCGLANCPVNQHCVEADPDPICVCDEGFFEDLDQDLCLPLPCGCPAGSYYGPPAQPV